MMARDAHGPHHLFRLIHGGGLPVKRSRIILAIVSGLVLVGLGVGLFGLFKVRHTLAAMTGEQPSLTDALHFLLPASDKSGKDALFTQPAQAAAQSSDEAASTPAVSPEDASKPVPQPQAPASRQPGEETATSPRAGSPASHTKPAPQTPVAEAMPVALKQAVPGTRLEPTSPQANPNRINILLLGVRGANEPDGAFLSDTIIVLSLLKDGQVALISIPRDLYVEIPGYGYHKINAAYAYGQARGDGLELAMRTVSKAAGIPIQYAVSVDWQAFKEIINSLGGVDVQVHQDFSGDGLTVKKGAVHMDGDVALNYAKSRVTTSDFDRSRRQREVLEALAAKLRSEDFFTQPLLVLKLLDTLGSHVHTTLGSRQLKALAERASHLDFADIVQEGFDTSTESPLKSTHLSNGVYIIVPKSGNYQAFQRVFKTVFQ
jgi:LCP family protein required for cell wall assembly